MIEEIGTIVELKEGKVAVVQCGRSSACQHCPSAGSCQMNDDQQTMLVEALNDAGGQLNDQVKVVTSTRNFLQSSFMLYIIPVVGLIIGAGVGQAFAQQLGVGVDPSLVSAILGLVCLILTFVGIRALTRTWQKERFMPRIVAIHYSKQANNGNA